MKFNQQTVDELQRLADRALQYVKDGKPEHTQDCFRRMTRILQEAECSPQGSSRLRASIRLRCDGAGR